MSNEIPQNNTNCTFVDLTYVTLFQNSEVVLKKSSTKRFKISAFLGTDRLCLMCFTQDVSLVLFNDRDDPEGLRGKITTEY